MRSLRVIVSLLLLAVLPVAASHTWLEELGLIHQEIEAAHADHCPDSHQHCGNHDFADGGCRLENSQVKVPVLNTAPWVALTLEVGLPFSLSVEVSLAAPPPNPSPPDLRPSWVFHSRAALPPRAPSCAS